MEENNTIQHLLVTVKKHHPEAEIAQIRRAYTFANNAHNGQARKSGEPYINHPLGTAITLAEMRMNETIVISGLLHDVPEDTQATLADIKREFGAEIAGIVDGVTKVGTIKYRGMERYAENLRKMFVSIAKDPRVVIVKFADRLYNLKTLYALPTEKQKRIAFETLEIYAPIAGRLGIGEMKDQLEDAAFRYALPDEYIWVRNLVIDKYFEKNRLVKKSIKALERELKKNKLNFIEVQGRAKRLYSLYQKLLRYDKNVEKIYDLIALRVIVPTISDCYAVLGGIHNMWTPLKGRVKDYISQPKPNGYQSLHTTVFSESGEILEVQIRTPEMHTESEYGVASHWQYKTTSDGQQKIPKNRIRWMKEITEWQKQYKTHKDYLDNLQNLKLDFLQNRIFVFTPNGDVIELPERATPIDFAYLIHSEIGNKCSGSLINGKMVSLDTPLKNGDVIEILTDKNRKGPSKDWLEFAKTHLARTRIRAYFNKKRG